MKFGKFKIYYLHDRTHVYKTRVLVQRRFSKLNLWSVWWWHREVLLCFMVVWTIKRKGRLQLKKTVMTVGSCTKILTQDSQDIKYIYANHSPRLLVFVNECLVIEDIQLKAEKAETCIAAQRMTMPTALHTTGSRVKRLFSLYTRRMSKRWITNAREVRKLAVRAQPGRIIWAYLLVEGYETRIGKKENFSDFYSRTYKGNATWKIWIQIR